MKAALVLVAVMLGGSADDLVGTKIGALKIGTPAAWKKAVSEGTHTFKAPSDDGEFAIDVFPLTSPLEAKICRDKLVQALGGEDWEMLSLGAAPAAKRSFIDRDEEKKQDIFTEQYVGCDGKTKWAMTFTFLAKRASRYAPLAEKVAASIQYGR